MRLIRPCGYWGLDLCYFRCHYLAQGVPLHLKVYQRLRQIHLRQSLKTMESSQTVYQDFRGRPLPHAKLRGTNPKIGTCRVKFLL